MTANNQNNDRNKLQAMKDFAVNGFLSMMPGEPVNRNRQFNEAGLLLREIFGMKATESLTPQSVPENEHSAPSFATASPIKSSASAAEKSTVGWGMRTSAAEKSTVGWGMRTSAAEKSTVNRDWLLERNGSDDDSYRMGKGELSSGTKMTMFM